MRHERLISLAVPFDPRNGVFSPGTVRWDLSNRVNMAVVGCAYAVEVRLSLHRRAMEYSVGSVKADSLNCSDSQLANVQSYGLSVQAAIGPKVLDGGGLEGRVLIAFSLGVDGTLVGVRIAQSSGHQRLDSQAAQLVGRASFPLPPAQLSATQRTYLSAFTFK